MIEIHPSPTADTRTCDWSKVTKETLIDSSIQHIEDIRAGLDFFKAALDRAGALHDHDKISGIDAFHADFATGFKQTGWWDNHRKVNRHHLLQEDGIPADVNLIDVLDFIVDCVMAGMARSGSVYALHLPPELLERAFQNTVETLKANVEVTASPPEEPRREEWRAGWRAGVEAAAKVVGTAEIVFAYGDVDVDGTLERIDKSLRSLSPPEEPRPGCPECEGLGWYTYQSEPSSEPQQRQCEECGGTGKQGEG